MLSHLTQVQLSELMIFFFVSVDCSIMYEQVVMLCQILKVLAGPAKDPCICH